MRAFRGCLCQPGGKERKMKYIYESNTEAIEIEVTEEWAEVLAELDRQEYNINHKETRRHVFIDTTKESVWLADPDLDPMVIHEKELQQAEYVAQLKKVMDILTEEQRELVHMRYELEMSVNEIADIKGVSPQAITNKFARMRKRLKKFL